MNDDRNILGRIIALALMVGATYGVYSIAHGRFDCSVGSGSSCVMGIPPETLPPAVEAKAAPGEKIPAEGDAGEDEDAKLEKKAPVVPPATQK
jgi:hypothetical protein